MDNIKQNKFYNICVKGNYCFLCRYNIKFREQLAKIYGLELNFKCPHKLIPAYNKQIKQNKQKAQKKPCIPCKKHKDEFLKLINK